MLHLTGTTAGYVGYEDGGQLTERVRRKPILYFCLMKLKSSSDVFNLWTSNFGRWRLLMERAAKLILPTRLSL